MYHSAIKHFLRLCLMLLCSVSSTSALAASYQFTGPAAIGANWVDISVTGTNVAPALTDDSNSAAIPVGFTFNYGGLNYTQVFISSNGMIFFGPAAPAPTGNWWINSTVATAQANYAISNVLMPYWDDLNPGGVAGRVKYQTIGTQFIISYLAVPPFSGGGTATFQVILNQNGTIRYNYQTTFSQGSTATVGYQISAADLVQVSSDTANSIPNNTTILWTRIAPSLINLKSVATVSDPVNNVTNPKNIPGAVVSYTINVNNASQGVVDTNTVSITDPIPTNTEMFTGGLSATAPFTFTDGSPASGLACTFVSLASATDCIEFSNNGGATWIYTPSAASDYDPLVTNIRLRPTGVMSGDTAPVASPYPNFNISFKARIK